MSKKTRELLVDEINELQENIRQGKLLLDGGFGVEGMLAISQSLLAKAKDELLALEVEELTTKEVFSTADYKLLVEYVECTREYIEQGAFEDTRIGFVDITSDQYIHDPFYDNTYRFNVDPIQAYGYTPIFKMIEAIKAMQLLTNEEEED